MKTAKNATKRGRPSSYRESAADQIIERITAGESLPAACATVGVARGTVKEWLDRHRAFSDRYARARELQADAVFDDIDRIEQGVLGGTIQPHAARVVIDSRKWRLARMLPKRYSERHIVEIGGSTPLPLKMYAVPEASPEAWPEPPAAVKAGRA